MNDHSSSRKCRKDHILGHSYGELRLYQKVQYDRSAPNVCPSYKHLEIGFRQNHDGDMSIGHRGFRNVYYEELKFNKALLNEFTSFLRKHRMSGKFALVNGYLNFHWGSGKANLVLDCNFKPSSSSKNYQLLVNQCLEYGSV